MSGFTHETPERVESQERWLKIFSKKAFISCLIVGFIGFLIFKSIMAAGHPFIGAGIGIFLVVLTYLLTSIRLWEGLELKGRGLTLDLLVFRIIWRKMNRVIYVKNYRREGDGR